MQMNGVKYCLEALGPWGAAAAAHLDLLSAVPDSAGDGEEDAAAAVPEEGEDDDEEAAGSSGEAGESLHQLAVGQQPTAVTRAVLDSVCAWA